MNRLASTLAALAFLVFAGAQAAEPLVLVHVHGLAFSADGERLMIPSHVGLAVFERGKWRPGDGPAHDYMGFAATRDRLFSSGHPGPGSTLVNPLGLMRSRDGGKVWEPLGLQGETDFHVMAASWSTNAIYVWNPAPSSRIRRPGLHQSADEGKTWQARAAGGVSGDPAALAVHPRDVNRVAIATDAGIFLSGDGGQRFERVAAGQGLAVLFELDGNTLRYSFFDGRPRLASLAAGARPAALPLPALDRDAVAYIAQNPVKRSTYAIATMRRDVHLSDDGGKTWTLIAKGGAKLN